MTDLTALKAANAKRWANAKLTRGPEFTPVARRLVAQKQRYLTVQGLTGVPWAFTAVAHQRESSQNFNGQLGQGDPLHQVSTHVPAGRGPFDTWEQSAVDALVKCRPFSASNKDWSIGGLLTALEAYNGFGYAARGIPSPYIWSGTDQYTSGKFIRDHVFDPNVVDKQLGCAGLLLAMMALDPTITFTGATITPNITITPIATERPKPGSIAAPPPRQPSVTNPAPGSIGATIAKALSAILSLFRKKT